MDVFMPGSSWSLLSTRPDTRVNDVILVIWCGYSGKDHTSKVIYYGKLFFALVDSSSNSNIIFNIL